MLQHKSAIMNFFTLLSNSRRGLLNVTMSQSGSGGSTMMEKTADPTVFQRTISDTLKQEVQTTKVTGEEAAFIR